ncbi:MAG: hypothetical protein ACTSYB_00660 [Candidatus Helarchaeota archaeon]
MSTIYALSFPLWSCIYVEYLRGGINNTHSIPACIYSVPHLALTGTQDVDKITEEPYEGHYLVTDEMGFIKIIDSATHIVLWEIDEPEFFVHDADMMPGGYSIIVADTKNDRVFEMNLSNEVILWKWYD